MLSEIPRKSLPKIARAVGLKDRQGLNYFTATFNYSSCFSLLCHPVSLISGEIIVLMNYDLLPLIPFSIY
jgi:hypothetical protein